ncbi:iron ABC transporter substrate-binding protein [Clostridium rectalis]|uniref:iron ABC transporter substrate-binding protein n=1 Tax=Clostridium rectalis TaxID=2040295 RepID=UPI000F63A547|nr:iron ABC transporter substrate-binding protein [Clostridium rectalis]
MNKKIISLAITMSMLVIILLSGCSSRAPSTEVLKEENISVTDMLGRKVSIKYGVKKVVAIGPGALRLFCYMGNIQKIVGVEQLEKGDPSGKPYMIANSFLCKLPVIGPGGPNNAPDAEKILSVNPDVIFTTYAIDKVATDALQSKTGIPVVALSYGEVSTFDPKVYESIQIIGKIMGEDKRANEVVEYMKKCQKDLDNRTKDIPDSEKPSVYVGALNMKGSHGIESTQGNYSLLNAVHGRNVVDEIGKTGSYMIDKEKLIQWNPDKIFIDLGGIKLVQEDYKKNPTFYKNLNAFKNGEVYSQLPYNYYTTNIDTAIADAYYIGKVLYPEKFKEINIEKKTDEIYKFLLGKKLYSKVSSRFGKFERIIFK